MKKEMDKITTIEDLTKKARAPFHVTFRSNLGPLRITGYGKTREEARNNLKLELEKIKEEISTIISKL